MCMQTTKKKTTKKRSPVVLEVLEVPPVKPAMELQAYSPAVLLSIAVEKGRSLEEISRLMDLQDRWEAKIAKADFTAAKSKFQKEVPRIIKRTDVSYPTKDKNGNLTNKTVDYSYAELGDIGETIKEAAFNNGFTYDWDIDDTGPKIIVECILTHIGGHEKKVKMDADADSSGGKNNIQAKSSTISYLQRITLIAAFGLTTAAKDDDGRSNQVFSKREEVSDPRKVSQEQFGPLMTSVITGKMTVEKIKEMRSLTEDQEKALLVAEESFKNKSNPV